MVKRKQEVKSFFVIAVLVSLILIAFGVYLSVNSFQKEQINDFQECLDAGFPVMESYPRQCSANGKTFIETLDDPLGGQKDEYGCLIAAGYSWNETIQTCVRSWLLKNRTYIAAYKSSICENFNLVCPKPREYFYDLSGCGCELEGTTQNEFN